VHIVAASIWVGGLLGLIVHLRRYPDQLRQAVPRFSAAALICVAAVGISGVLASVVLLDDWVALWATSRGQLILAKTVALVVLTAIGYQHRRFTVGAACSGRLGPLLRWGAAELTLMSATIGIAVVLSTTA
jgi:putative copper resistance protein D